MTSGVSPETCWASYTYGIIKILIHCCILLYFLLELCYDARTHEHQVCVFKFLSLSFILYWKRRSYCLRWQNFWRFWHQVRRLGRGIDYCDGAILYLWFTSVRPGRWLGRYLHLVPDGFLPHDSQFIIDWRSYRLTLYRLKILTMLLTI